MDRQHIRQGQRLVERRAGLDAALGELLLRSVAPARSPAPTPCCTALPTSSCARRNGTPCSHQVRGGGHGIHESRGGSLLHALVVEANRADKAGGHPQHAGHLSRRLEHRLLRLLHVLVVGQRQALQRHQQRRSPRRRRGPLCRESAPARRDFSSAAWRCCRSRIAPATARSRTPAWRTESTLPPSGSGARPATTSACTNSMAKSRSLVASMLLAVGPSKSSSRAMASRSSGRNVPATAPDPSGHRFTRRGNPPAGPGRAETSPHTPAANAPPAPARPAADEYMRAWRSSLPLRLLQQPARQLRKQPR